MSERAATCRLTGCPRAATSALRVAGDGSATATYTPLSVTRMGTAESSRAVFSSRRMRACASGTSTRRSTTRDLEQLAQRLGEVLIIQRAQLDEQLAEGLAGPGLLEEGLGQLRLRDHLALDQQLAQEHAVRLRHRRTALRRRVGDGGVARRLTAERTHAATALRPLMLRVLRSMSPRTFQLPPSAQGYPSDRSHARAHSATAAAVRNIAAVASSTSGYRIEMEARHVRHLPLSRSHDATGTLSIGRNGVRQRGHREPGESSDSPSGTRCHTTFRNEPTAAPSAAVSTSVNTLTGLV